ncbi:thiamine pyrophosphate-requiring protein [Microbacterium timonense]|uniref:thiamine pyrophosphate-requiring protein n=1 Tax=Microbacterium timonense TaxID=2086576 RepID=UPI000D10C387|nr:thiamine pyrophosphate-requiring protein [Microbacterium timonense]
MGGHATVADVVVARLIDWGVDRIYGYSGDGINPLIDALRRSADAPAFVQARHEENAAFMAVGQAKFTGGTGVVLSTQGPGAIHLLNGLYDARLDHVPVVALVGQQHRSVLGSGYMQEVDLRVLFSDVALYVAEAATAEQFPLVIDEAFRNARGGAGPAVVILPHDVQQEPAPQHPHEHGVVATAASFTRADVRARDEDITAAAALLDSSERPAILVGRGAEGAWEAVRDLAVRLGAAVTTSLLGKPHVDERHPLVAGTMGHLGTTASAAVLAECDALLIVGSNDPWTEYYPPPGQARAVQIDIDPRRIGDRYPVEVALASDAGVALQEILPRLAGSRRDDWRSRVMAHVEAWHDVRRARAAVEAEPVNPEAVVAALADALPDDPAIAVDVGSVVYWYARQLILPAGSAAHLSATLASMGCGVPYGVAAKCAESARPVLVLAGDGGMQMTGVSELITVSDRWRDWADPRFVVAVFDNGELSEVSWEQREMEEAPRNAATQDLPPFPYAEYARMLGLGGEIVERPDQIAAAWRRAFRADRPYVLQFRTDPAIPLLPPLASGHQKTDAIRRVLQQEAQEGGSLAARALRLLDEYVEIERSADAVGP